MLVFLMQIHGRKLTPGAEHALKDAAEEAEDLGHTYIGTEHLLLGLLKERGGLAGLVLAEVAGEEAIRERLQALMFPPPLPGFENYPGPWGSGVVHDAAMRPVKDGVFRLRQYFIDKNGNPVRNAAGRLIHLLVDDRGQPVLDENGHVAFVEVEVGPEHLDSRGRPFSELLKGVGAPGTEQAPGRQR